MNTPRLDDLPGFRRRIAIVPGPGAVTAAVEDDFHHMTVTLRHDGRHIGEVEAKTIRAPWTTCPGAEVVLGETFTGVALDAAARPGLKQANCTHLYDIAALAAAHASDPAPTLYEVLVSDPVEDEIVAEIRQNGEALLRWSLREMTLTAPNRLAGLSLLALREPISTMPPPEQEAARILQWACLIAHGRQLPLDQQSDATRMPPNCYTFQPDRAREAVRVGQIIDFSRSGRQPLESGKRPGAGAYPWK